MSTTNIIRLKRGLKENLPVQDTFPGQPYVTLDSRELFVSDGLNGLKKIGDIVVGSATPSVAEQGKLWVDSTTNTIKRYNGTEWVEIAGASIIDDVNPSTGTTYSSQKLEEVFGTFYTKSEIDTKVTDLEQAIADEQTRAEAVEADHETRVTAVESELADAHSSLAKGTLAEDGVTVVPQTFASLDARFEDAETEIKALEDAIDNFRNSSDASYATKTELQTEIQARTDADAALQTALDAVETRVDTAEGRLDAIEAKDVEQDGKIAALETEVQGARKASADLATELDRIEAKADQAQADVDAAEVRITTNEGAITTLQGRMDTAEADIDQLQTDVAGLSTDKADQSYVDTELAKKVDKADLEVTIPTLGQDGYVKPQFINPVYREMKVIPNLDGLDAIEPKFEGLRVHVVDKGDGSFGEYLHNGTEFILVADASSVSVEHDWNIIENKPAEVDQFGTSPEGKLMFKGAIVNESEINDTVASATSTYSAEKIELMLQEIDGGTF